MPVRIYDIAKKLGIESKEVLAKAKALGISGAKVPSSSLDKITAEYLEEQLGGRKPVAVAEPPPAPAPPEPILIVSAPPDNPTLAAPALPADTTLKVDAARPIAEAPVAAPLEPTMVEAKSEPLAPPSPPKPALGDKIGFIQLPQKPPPRIGAKASPAKLPPKPAPAMPPARPAGRQAVPALSQRPAGKPPVPLTAPAAPKFVPPTTGELI